MHERHTQIDRSFVSVCLLLGIVGTIHAVRAEPAPLTPETYSQEQRIVDLLWERSADIATARAGIGSAHASLVRAHLVPNPQLDAQWGTIPVGRTNPSGLHSPLRNVPNYTAGLSELLEIGKRGPRQAAARADLEQARAETEAIVADRFFAVMEHIAAMAMNQQRASVLDEQIGDNTEVLDLNRARADKGEIPPLEVDVAEVEHARLVASRDTALSEMAKAQADCSSILATACPPFASGDTARSFLESAASLPLSMQWTEEAEQRRPDLAALDAAARSAEERITLANRSVIPDVNVRLGYTYDEFILSGSQRNSLAVGVQVPMPVFDHGQADLIAALSEKQRARNMRSAILSAAPDLLAAAWRGRALTQQRIRHLDSALERARTVSDAMIEAQRAGGISLLEALVARRAYQDLLRERVELDADFFNTTLDVRRTLGLFPRPHEQEGGS